MKVGVDIVNIKTFKEKDFVKYETFYRKIFTKEEIKYCLNKAEPYQHFAARFAAKEAVIKTISKKINIKDIEIYHKNSKPHVKIKDQELEIQLSISHDGDYAIAFALSQNE